MKIFLRISSGLLLFFVLLYASGITQQAYNLIQGNGTPAARGTTLNMANTASVTWSCTTSGIVTSCSATASGGGGGSGGGIVTYSGPALTPSGTQFVAIGGGALASTTEANVQVGAPSAATVSALFVNLSAAPGAGNSIAFTWRDGASSKALTCTIANTATSCSDTTHSFTVAQGDLVDIQLVTTGTVLVTPVTTIATAYGTTGTAGYLTIQNNGTPLAQEAVLNLNNGTNTTMVCADNPGVATNCQVNATGGGGGFIQPLTAPVSGNFSDINFNAGGTTTTQTNNSSPVTSINLKQHDPGGSQQIVGLLKAKIAATFTVTVAFAIAGDVQTNPVAGLWLADSTPAKNLFWGFFQTGGALTALTFNNLAGSFGGFLYQQGTPPWTQGGPLVWMRIKETVSARNYYTSSDGINFNLVYTESNTANFTTASYGFGETTRGSGIGGELSITCYSFTETNP